MNKCESIITILGNDENVVINETLVGEFEDQHVINAVLNCDNQYISDYDGYGNIPIGSWDMKKI